MKFIFTGDVLHAGKVAVTADTEEEAHEKLKAGDFEVYDEESHHLGFNWNECEIETEPEEGEKP